MRTWCLSIHAAYACRHSGACCTAGWPIPIELYRVEQLRQRATLPRIGGAFLDAGDARGVTTVRADAGGACVFFDRGGGRLCVIQRDAGAELMPAACRNFPRVGLRDARGLRVTLSHFCPTAAGMLLDAGSIEIVEAPPTLSLDGDVEGLDASSVLPPLLRPGMLMDLDGYSAWEREAIAVLDDRTRTPRDALCIIAAATEDACGWRPGTESLATRMSRAFERARAAAAPRREGACHWFSHPLKAFLAGHLFASWSAYQRGGLMSVIDDLHRALRLAGEDHADPRAFVAAVRDADLRLRHTTARAAEPSPSGCFSGRA